MTNRWRIHLNRTELPTEPSLMPDHIQIPGMVVNQISGWEMVREIRLDKHVKELPPDTMSLMKEQVWHDVHPVNVKPMQVVKTEPLEAG